MTVVNFQEIKPVEKGPRYLENALKRAAKRVSMMTFKGTPIERLRRKEVERVVMVRDALAKYLSDIDESFPNLDTLPEFYRLLIAETLNYERFKRALGSIKFARNTIARLSKENIRKLRMQENPDSVRRIVASHLGRVSSVLKRIAPNLDFLDRTRATLRSYPALDPEQFTVAIAGFPNVGKSTLLSKLTTARPEIKAYAFTTKGLNVGIFEHRFNPIQLVDTPGTLARGKENEIERLATITRQNLARLVIYVFDPTEEYPLEDQERLLANIRAEGHETILYLSKTDIVPARTVQEFSDRFPGILTTPAEVKKAVVTAFKEWL